LDRVAKVIGWANGQGVRPGGARRCAWMDDLRGIDASYVDDES
jgi:hypothetical protein